MVTPPRVFYLGREDWTMCAACSKQTMHERLSQPKLWEQRYTTACHTAVCVSFVLMNLNGTLLPCLQSLWGKFRTNRRKLSFGLPSWVSHFVQLFFCCFSFLKTIGLNKTKNKNRGYFARVPSPRGKHYLGGGYYFFSRNFDFFLENA